MKGPKGGNGPPGQDGLPGKPVCMEQRKLCTAARCHAAEIHVAAEDNCFRPTCLFRPLCFKHSQGTKLQELLPACCHLRKTTVSILSGRQRGYCCPQFSAGPCEIPKSALLSHTVATFHFQSATELTQCTNL